MDYLPEWAEFAKELNEKSANELGAVSTLIYLEKSGDSPGEFRTAFLGLKPQLSGRLEAALALLGQWRSTYGEAFKVA